MIIDFIIEDLMLNSYLQKNFHTLVETCFDGMSYKDLKDSVVLEMKRISDILSQWLETQSLSIKPL